MQTPLGVRYQLKDELLEYLYTTTRQYQAGTLIEIIQQNDVLCGKVHNSMQFRGRYYSFGSRVDTEGPVNTLHRNLRERFKEWEAMGDKTVREKARVDSFLGRLFMYAPTFDMLQGVLPDALHSVLNKYAEYLPTVESEEAKAVDLAKFLQDNEQYLDTIKMRLTKNLIGAGY